MFNMNKKISSKIKKILSVALCSALLLSFTPTSIFAKDSGFVPPDDAFRGQVNNDGTPVKWPDGVKWIDGIPWTDEITDFNAGGFGMNLLMKLNGDIEVNGETEKDAVYETKKSAKLNVTGVLDVSPIKKQIDELKNTDTYKNNDNIPLTATQSTFITRITLPDELSFPEVLETEFTGAGDVFKVTDTKKEGNTVTVIFKLKDGISSFEQLHRDITSVDDKLKVTVKNVEIKKEAKYDTNYTMHGSVGGYMYSRIMDDQKLYMAFYTMQDPDGKDAFQNKEEISFTLKIKQVNHTVTFMNDDKEYKKVNVEEGLSIDEDSLTDQSMPTNPTKSGYTFKGWATKKDAKTPDFTGKTVVNNDLTVYAIWEKNSTPVNPGGSTTDPTVPNKPERIDGNDRIETAVKVSQKSYPNGTKAVILANKDKFSDVLTAVPFSVQIGAPILFTNTDSIPVETKNEIKRLGATQVYINGGTSSVTQSIEDTLKKEGKSVTRFNGVDRYDTAKLIGERVRANGSKDVVEIASGETFPDALSISSLAVKENAPILLSKKNDLTPVTKKAISDWKIEKVTIAGQTNTISAMVEKDVTNVIKKTSRLGGADRYETSAIIAKAAVPDSTLGVYTSGEVFADALVAGPYAGINKAPVLLVNKDRVPTSIAKYTKESKINRAVVIGGTSTVYDSTFNQIKDLIAKK